MDWMDPDDYVDKGYYNELISYEKECIEKGKKCIFVTQYNWFPYWDIWIYLHDLSFLYNKLKNIEIYKLIINMAEDVVFFELFIHNILRVNMNNRYYYNRNNSNSLCHIFKKDITRFDCDYIELFCKINLYSHKIDDFI